MGERKLIGICEDCRHWRQSAPHLGDCKDLTGTDSRADDRVTIYDFGCIHWEPTAPDAEKENHG